MIVAPARRLLWLAGALAVALVATVAVFELQQATRQPVLHGSAPFVSGTASDESR